MSLLLDIIELAKKIAINSVKEAGRMLMNDFDKLNKMSLKGKSDIVTDIDLKSEKIILDAIKNSFPFGN